MRVVRSVTELGAVSSSVVTIGNFDGLHLGHAAILSEVRAWAARTGSLSVAVTFAPHPLEVLAPDRAPTPISTLRQKVALIASTGIDVLLIQPFDRDFSRQSPVQFIEEFLIGGLKTVALCVGHNFRFGHGHRGNVETLRAWSEHFTVIEVPPVRRGNRMVSSTRIRELLLAGDVRAARRLLGRCYEIEGRIVAGDGRGRRRTVPTLNLDPENRLMPADGVYLTRASVNEDDYTDALTNVGRRPTFPEADRALETYLLAAPSIGGGETLRIRFLNRLRDERRFPDAEALRSQILIDIESAVRYFGRVSRARSPSHAP